MNNLSSLNALNPIPKAIFISKEAQSFFDNINYQEVPDKVRWANNQEIIIGFVEGTDQQKLDFRNGLKFWSNYVNLQFRLTNNLEQAMVRVGYRPEESYSYIGKEVLYIQEERTLNIGWEGIDVILNLIGKMLGFVALNEYRLKNEIDIDLSSSGSSAYISWIE